MSGIDFEIFYFRKTSGAIDFAGLKNPKARFAGRELPFHIRYWGKADMTIALENVR
jgi:hypothetical protein